MQPIPIVAFGVYSQFAVKSSAAMFARDTPPRYQIVAAMDMGQEWTAKGFSYSAHNLAVVLRALRPAPRAFVAGLMVPEAESRESVAVWEAFVRERAEGEGWGEGGEGLLIDLRTGTPDGTSWQTYTLKCLDERFFPEKKGEL